MLLILIFVRLIYPFQHWCLTAVEIDIVSVFEWARQYPLYSYVYLSPTGGVPVGGFHFNNPFIYLKNGNIKGSSTQIIHSY